MPFKKGFNEVNLHFQAKYFLHVLKHFCKVSLNYELCCHMNEYMCLIIYTIWWDYSDIRPTNQNSDM